MAIINGTNGNDVPPVLNGTNGADIINGRGGHDDANGFGGNDTVKGGSGDDSLSGGKGNDKVFGESGNDKLRGNENNDRLDGGAGNDLLTGGTGQDTFVYHPAQGNDTITDFNFSDDKIDIAGVSAEQLRNYFDDNGDGAIQVGETGVSLQGGAMVLDFSGSPFSGTGELTIQGQANFGVLFIGSEIV